jgi:DNA-binding NarL/FixJ family response regulator
VFKERVKEAAVLSSQKRWEKNVLIIENDPDWAIKLKNVLNKNGYGSDIISNFQEGKEIIDKYNYRVVVTDLNCEGSFEIGFDFIKEINSLKPQTDTIIISDSGDKSAIRDAFVKYNVTDFQLKEESRGFDEDGFIQQIKNIFMPENELFIVPSFKELNEENKFLFSLTTQKYVQNRTNAASIRFPPQKREIGIEVILYTDQDMEELDISPSSSQRWVITKNDKFDHLSFIITPKKKGDFSIYPEIFGDDGFWRRLNEIYFKA